MLSRNEILNIISKDQQYEEVLCKYLSSVEERNEFRQFIWVELCEIPNEKIEQLWNGGHLLFYYAQMIKNQIASKSSKWYREYKKPSLKTFQYDEHVNQEKNSREILSLENQENSLIEKEIQDENFLRIIMIHQAISHHLNKNPRLKIEFDLFKMKHIDGLSYREIENKTHIPLMSCFNYVRNAEILIRNNINQKLNRTR